MPLWVETTLPTQPNGLRRPWQHMVFAQDLGGDIQGVNRLDLFTGWGQIAEWYAGLMKEKGKIYILLPRQPVNSTGKTDALVLPPAH
ncbi:MAG: 3D domain-containing protein [Commensalibacter sp.]|nr:3D domain-containing protein [Commensalibacter sp.]